MRPVTASLEEGAWGRNLAKVSLPLTQPNRLLHYGPPSPRVEINNLRVSDAARSFPATC
jgi:hypothetical protein